MAKADSSDTTIAPAEMSRRDFPQLVRVRPVKTKKPRREEKRRGKFTVVWIRDNRGAHRSRLRRDKSHTDIRGGLARLTIPQAAATATKNCLEPVTAAARSTLPGSEGGDIGRAIALTPDGDQRSKSARKIKKGGRQPGAL